MWGVSPKWGFYELTADSDYEACFKPRNSSSYLDRVLPPDTPEDHLWLRWTNGDRKGFLPPHCKDRYLDDLENWKLDDVRSGLKRFSSLKHCYSWIEDELDNEGRFVADGVVTFVFSDNLPYSIIKTKYGNCYGGGFKLQVGEKVKILCEDHVSIDPWFSHLKIKCIKIYSGSQNRDVGAWRANTRRRLVDGVNIQ